MAEGEKQKYLDEREKLLKACRKVYNDSRTELRKELEEFVAGVQQEIDRMKQQTAEREKELKQAQENELNGKGADTVTIRKYDDRLAEINKELELYQANPVRKFFIMKETRRNCLIRNLLREAGRKNWMRS